jgi:hypothetical protein
MPRVPPVTTATRAIDSSSNSLLAGESHVSRHGASGQMIR